METAKQQKEREKRERKLERKQREQAAAAPQGRAAGDFFLRVAAIWFGGTVYDTNDISTVRGASLALLFAPERLFESLQAQFGARATLTRVISGASTLVLLCSPLRDADDAGDRLEADIAQAARTFLATRQRLAPQAGSAVSSGNPEKDIDPGNDIELADMRFTVAVVPAGRQNAIQTSLAQLAAIAGRQQYSTPSIVAPSDLDKPFAASSVCRIDGVNPAHKKDHTTPVSRSVLHRRAFGRARKKDFYLGVLRDADDPRRDAVIDRVTRLEFSRSLGDLLEFDAVEGPPRLGLSPALSGKIAVIHLDGNRFGAAMGSIAERGKLARFSSELRRHQANLLVDLLDWAVPAGLVSPFGNDMLAPASQSPETGEWLAPRIRLETLLWGGDEMVFALPAWRGWEAVGVLERGLRRFVIGSAGAGTNAMQRNRDLFLTHAIGLAFANVKTPIRLLKAMADKLAGSAKTDALAAFDTFFGFQVGVVASVDVPDGDIGKVRRAAFSVGGDGALLLPGSDNRSRAGAPPPPDWPQISGKLARLARLLPASQTSRLIELADKIGVADIQGGVAADDWEKALSQQLARQFKGRAKELAAVKALLADPQIGGRGKGPLQPILWNRYFDGFVLPVEPRDAAMRDAHLKAIEAANG